MLVVVLSYRSVEVAWPSGATQRWLDPVALPSGVTQPYEWIWFMFLAFGFWGPVMLVVAKSYGFVEVACDAHVVVSYGFMEVQ